MENSFGQTAQPTRDIGKKGFKRDRENSWEKYLKKTRRGSGQMVNLFMRESLNQIKYL